MTEMDGAPREVCEASTIRPQSRWASSLIAILFALTALGSVDVFWRSRGLVPSVPDSKGLWTVWRHRHYSDTDRVVDALSESVSSRSLEQYGCHDLSVCTSEIRVTLPSSSHGYGSFLRIGNREPTFFL